MGQNQSQPNLIMLSISTPIKHLAAAVKYYLDDRKVSYYLNGVDKEGTWFGQGAARLGLRGSVQSAEFYHLLSGRTPDGRQSLVQNAGRADRQCGWDMTFNAPKDVSVLWSVSPLPIRQAIEASHQLAVQTALRVAEEVAGISRSGPGGRVLKKADLVWATFQEGASRAQDPHVHTHAVLMNLGLRQDGSTGSIATTNLFRWKMALGAIYLTDLAARLTHELGLTIHSERNGFSIEGVSQELAQHLSKRRQKIVATMAERGEEGPIAARTAAKDTRPPKLELSAAKLFAHWQETARQYGWGPEQVTKLIGKPREVRPEQSKLDQAVDHAARQLAPDQQTRSSLVRAVARVGLDHGAGGLMLLESLRQIRLPTGQRALWKPQWSQSGRLAQRSESGHALTDAHQTQEQSPAQPQVDQPITQSQESPRQSPEPLPVRVKRPRSQRQQRKTKNAGQQQTRNAGREQTKNGHQRQTRNAGRGQTNNTGQGQTNNAGQEQTNNAGHGQTKNAQQRRTRNAHQQETEDTNTWESRDPRQEGTDAESREEAAAESRLRSRQLFGPVHLAWKALYDKEPWLEEKGKFLHLRWSHPFAKGLWAPGRRIALPTLAVELPYLRLGPAQPFVPRWQSIHWRKKLGLVELRVQQRTICPDAPAWSPLHRVSVPSLRFALKLPSSSRMHRSAKPKQASSRKKPGHSHGHSH